MTVCFLKSGALGLVSRSPCSAQSAAGSRDPLWGHRGPCMGTAGTLQVGTPGTLHGDTQDPTWGHPGPCEWGFRNTLYIELLFIIS